MRDSVTGLFITMEGPDGAGKTSVIEHLIPRLEAELGLEIVSTREPGGSPIAESIREIILDVKHVEMDSKTEAILYAAARRQHLVDRILPNLQAGKLVFCDRFVDSSLVYQGIGRGIGVEEVRSINQFATEGLEPDLTLYLDVPAEIGLSRIHKAKGDRQFDRLDQEGISFHQSVRQGYLELIQEAPQRFRVIDASRSLDQVVEACYHEVKEFLTQN